MVKRTRMGATHLATAGRAGADVGRACGPARRASRACAGLGYYRVQLYSTLGIGCNRDAQPWCAVSTLLP